MGGLCCRKEWNPRGSVSDGRPGESTTTPLFSGKQGTRTLPGTAVFPTSWPGSSTCLSRESLGGRIGCVFSGLCNVQSHPSLECLVPVTTSTIIGLHKVCRAENSQGCPVPPPFGVPQSVLGGIQGRAYHLVLQKFYFELYFAPKAEISQPPPRQTQSCGESCLWS